MELVYFRSIFRFTISLVMGFFLFSWNQVECITSINTTTGGYIFTIGIDSKLPEPNSGQALETYINKLRTSVQRLSNQMFISTKGVFHIEEVGLLFPTTWNSSYSVLYGYSTTESYLNSDVRLSSSINTPFVSNPHTCGLPGNYIELPATHFFNGDVYDESFGPIEKAFLTQWARFRWGVWEEHGSPSSSDSRFPYFYQPNPNEEDVWEATTCSDTPLVGDFINIDGEVCTPPASSCRFIPSPNQPQPAPTSSLMGYHWLESVHHFCNSSTHNIVAPNPQNLFCMYKSVWEVIESSPDFTALAEDRPPLGFIPLPKLNILRPNPYPAFHLLIDRGIIQSDTHLSIINTILHGPIPLFDEGAKYTLGSVSAYRGEGDGFLVEKLVDWKVIGDHADEFYEKIAEYRTDYNRYRDFGFGLLSATGIIEELDPLGGTVLLIIKAAAVESNFASRFPEEETYARMAKAKIRVFAAEVQNSTESPLINLKSLVGRTGGSHVTCLNPTQTAVDIQELVNEIKSIIDVKPGQDIPLPVQDKSHVLSQGRLIPNEVVTINTPVGLSQLQIHLTLPTSFNPILNVNGNILNGTFRNEWDEEYVSTRRRVHTFTPTIEEASRQLNVEYTCSEGCDPVTTYGYLVIAGQLSDNNESEFSNLVIQTNTNAIGHVLNFSTTTSPFLIYTTVLLGGYKPVSNVIVTASITRVDIGTLSIIELKDDGEGSADLLEGDGVYSGFFIPESDGAHKVSIKVEVDNSKLQVTSKGEGLRLLPIDQGQIGCPDSECGSSNLNASFSRISVINDVTMVNYQQYLRGKPSKIRDLVATVERHAVSNGERLVITFTSPRVLGIVDNISAKSSRYLILGSNSTEFFLSDTIGELVSTFFETKEPGFIEEFIMPLSPTTKRFNYYAVHSFYSDFPTFPVDRNVKSNIAQVSKGEWRDDSTTTTEQSSIITTTTTESGITESTTTDSRNEEDSGFFKSAGGIVVIILIVLVGGGSIGGVVYYYISKR